MDKEKLDAVLAAHKAWLNKEPNGVQAILEGANLRGANLRGANLSGAYLRWASLSGADLRWASLRGADLIGADLAGADLHEADLRGADLNSSCLDPMLLRKLREFCRACPPNRYGGRVVYRTATSQWVGATEYAPGHTYSAPVLSFDSNTDCHPGIYAGSIQQISGQYPDKPLVRCYVRDGEWVITRKGIRCHKLRVLEYVD
jgi:hypothetical protein